MKWLGSLLSALASALGLAKKRAESEERNRDEEAGARKQREANLKDAAEKREEQLREAIDHREGDWRRHARRREF